ncbi:MAG: hypothetical protein RIS70_4495 [Planctomycetota bacterium]|jgi:hypothetical protein
MASVTRQIPVPAHVKSVLAGLRWRIRCYLLVEGIALAACWLCSTFWASFACDYLPILVGASELPQGVRGLILAAVMLVCGVIVYRWVVRRLAVPMSDRSLAILLERRFAQFRDALVTTVELLGRPLDVPVSNDMLALTSRDAEHGIGEVRLRDVFNFRPLFSKLAAAALLGGSLGLFYFASPGTFSLAANRLLLLDSSPWPRSARIEMVGVEVIRQTVSTTSLNPIMQFSKGRLKVAKGTSLNLKVRADALAAVVPDSCTIQYRTAQGESGRVTMKRVGQVRTEQVGDEKISVQNYTFDGKPFKGVLTDFEFDVIGYDHRLSGFHIDVVESPALSEIVLDCKLPDYIVDDPVLAYRQIPYLPSGTQVPLGAEVTVKASATKPLQQVLVHFPESKENKTIEGPFGDDGQSVKLPLDRLQANTTVELTLIDTDQVATERPVRVAIAVVPDESPRVDVRLRGIGTAVTPDVSLPMQGKITDDYGVARAWIDLQVNDREPLVSPVSVGSGGAVESVFDFRRFRQSEGGFELKPTDKLSLRLDAEDRFSLGAGPNRGSGDQYQLNVVTPSELMAMLEARELALRRRFEQTIEEMTEMRDTLLRVKVETLDGTNPARDPEDKDPTDAKLDPQAELERARSLRMLRLQKSTQQNQKSSQEVLGVSVSFGEIREEMINNRLEATDRIEQLRDKIIEPLRALVDADFAKLQERLQALESLPLQASSVGEVDQAVQGTDALLAKLNDILQNMLDIETYNELLDIVRGMIKEQDDLIKKTKDQRKKQLIELTK